jgi:thioredoxin-like negative regulator of GroEL
MNPQYLVQLGFLQVAIADGSSGSAQRAARQDALDTYHRLNTRFAPSASSLVREAEARANLAFSTDAEKQAVFDLLERAVKLDPNGAEVRQGVAAFYVSVGEADRAAPHLAWMQEHGVQPLAP